AGPLAQLGGNRGGIAGSEIEAHGVVIPRAGGEIGRRPVGENPAAGDDDGAVAHRLDLLQKMRRDDDRLMRAQLANDAAHLVFLVRVEPVGRLSRISTDGSCSRACATPTRRRYPFDKVSI